MFVCVRYYYRFVLKIAPQSTAVPKADAPNPWALLHYPQCSAKWLLYPSLQRWKWEKSFSLNVFLFFFLISRLHVPEFLSLLPKRENKTETVLCLEGKLYCDILLSWLWEPHDCTSLCDSPQRWNEKSRIEHCDEKREWVQVESSKNDTIWNIYNVIIYYILMSEVTADHLFPVSFLWRI